MQADWTLKLCLWDAKTLTQSESAAHCCRLIDYVRNNLTVENFRVSNLVAPDSGLIVW